MTNKMDKCILRRFSIARIQPKLNKKLPDFFYIYLAFKSNLAKSSCGGSLPTLVAYISQTKLTSAV